MPNGGTYAFFRETSVSVRDGRSLRKRKPMVGVLITVLEVAFLEDHSTESE